MASKPKRMKLNKPATQKLEDEPVEDEKQRYEPKRISDVSFMTLNNDCIFAILQKLSLSNLCAISQTCQRLQTLAFDHFKRCHKSKVLTITDAKENGQLVVWPKEEKYIRCFEKCIQNVTFEKSLAKKSILRDVYKVYRFKKMDKMAPIKTLRIEGWGRGIRMSHRPALANLVKDVESITIANTKVLGDLNECLLKHIPNMKRLTLWQKFIEEPGTDTVNWMQQIYPKLEYFAWHADQNVPVGGLMLLFELNPNINFFSLYSKSRDTLGQLFNEGIRIDELFVVLNRSNMTAMFSDLQIMCEQQFCKRLHLKFSDAARPMLTTNLGPFMLLGPYIEGLYFEKLGIDMNLTQIIMTFDHLKVLQLNVAVNANFLSKIVSLEEIYAYWGVDKTNFNKYQAAMLTYAKNTPKLKKIYLRNNSQPFDRFDFVNLDLARKDLHGANKLKIYFKSEECSFTGKLNAIECDYDMVEIVRVETEHVDNPLITEYLTTKQLSQSPWLDYIYGR